MFNFRRYSGTSLGARKARIKKKLMFGLWVDILHRTFLSTKHLYTITTATVGIIIIIIIIKQLSLMIPSGHNYVVQTKGLKVLLCIINFNTIMLCGSQGKYSFMPF
jgi:hypothetical protein